MLEHGFKWNGATYRSLSAIARAITGTKWNGHVFFGLKPRQSPYSMADSATIEVRPVHAKRMQIAVSGTPPMAEAPSVF